MKAADLEALAQRVEREEPSEALRCEVLRAFGWVQDEWWGTWRRNGGERLDQFADPLRSRDAAASLEKPEWDVSIDKIATGLVYVSIRSGGILVAEVVAPDEPRARTAAALRACAQEARDDG